MRPKTLFATTTSSRIADATPGVVNFTSPRRVEGRHHFLRKVIPGRAVSYGIQVARLAGLRRRHQPRAQILQALGRDELSPGRRRR